MSFVDTNVLVQSAAMSAPYRAVARAALSRLRARGLITISHQIMREYLAVVTRPQAWSAALDVAEATADTDTFSRRFRILEDGPAVWAELMRLSRSFKFGGRQIHDANIVATMLAHGETELLTFNQVDFRRFGSLIQVVSP